MLDADEREGSSRGRLDLLLEQLGAAPLEGGVLERLNALGESMGMTVDGGQSVRLRGARDFDSRLAGNPRPFQSVRAAGLGRTSLLTLTGPPEEP